MEPPYRHCLPNEILLMVLSHLDLVSLVNLSRACHNFHALARPLLLPRAILEDEAFVTTPEKWTQSCSLGSADPASCSTSPPPQRALPCTLKIVMSGCVEQTRRLVDAGAHLGCFTCAVSVSPHGHDNANGNDNSGGRHLTLRPLTTTPLHVASAMDRADLVALILAKIPPGGVDLMAMKPWLDDDTSPHKMLLARHHHMTNPSESPSTTALHTALASQASDQVVLDLILAGAVWDLPLTNAHGLTALHLMAANGRTSLLREMADLGIEGLDWPDHQGYRAVHYAAFCRTAPGDAVAALELVNALARVGATLEPLRDDRGHRRYTRKLVARFSRNNRGAMLLDPDGVREGRPWLPTDQLMPSGAVVDVDWEHLKDVPAGPVPTIFAALEDQPALAKALGQAGLAS